jgi:hypothetical protein
VECTWQQQPVGGVKSTPDFSLFTHHPPRFLDLFRLAVKFALLWNEYLIIAQLFDHFFLFPSISVDFSFPFPF